MTWLRLVTVLALTAPMLAPATAARAQERSAPACFPQRYAELRKIPDESRTFEQQQEFEQLQRACADAGAAAVVRQRAGAAATPAGGPRASATPAAPASGRLRHGFWFTGGLGYASLGCQGCDTRVDGMAVGIGLGGTVSQHVQLGAGIHGWSKSEGDATVTASTLTGTIRVYPSARGRFFLLGGLGAGSISARAHGWSGNSDAAGAAVIGLGYDVRLSRTVSFTPFYNGVGMAAGDWDANFAQLGIAITTY